MFGRGSIARRRVNRQRPPSLQAQGSDRRQHQGSEAPHFPPEAGAKRRMKLGSQVDFHETVTIFAREIRSACPTGEAGQRLP